MTVTALGALTISARGAGLSGPGGDAWSRQAARDADALVKAGQVQQAVDTPSGLDGEWVKRLNRQVHDAAARSLNRAYREQRRGRLRRVIREDLEGGPRGPARADTQAQPDSTADAQPSRLLDTGTDYSPYTHVSGGLADPLGAAPPTVRTETRLSFDAAPSASVGASGQPGSSGNDADPSFSTPERARPSHRRPIVRPGDANASAGASPKQPDDSVNNRPGSNTRPSPGNADGNDARAPARRNTRGTR